MSTETKQPLDIGAIKAREAAATAGPWLVEASGDVDFKFYVCAPWPDAPELGPEHAIGAMAEHADALFAVYAREDIPALLERIAELEAALRPMVENQAQMWSSISTEPRGVIRVTEQELRRARQALGIEP